MLHDVVIAGAGPVGLLLACELRLAGVGVLVLERERESEAPLKQLPFGMRGLSIPTVEALDGRGLLSALAASHATLPRRQAGHFAGIALDYGLIDPSRWRYRLPGPAADPMAVELARLEAVLVTHATALGAEIRRGCAVDGLEQSADGVTVHAGGQVFHARWLVGCDGGRSIVRKAAGFAFVGTDAEFTGYSVQVDMADPEKIRPGRNATATGMYFHSQPGVIAMASFDAGAAHRTRALTLAHVQAVLREVSGTDVTVTRVRVATTWTDRAYQATAYRNGRVLLAGDAAHIHSPLGGQGLNLGVGDAMNLGWKLAATLRGTATPGLLDSYADERRPIAAQALDWSRAQVALMRPGRGARALEAVMRGVIHTKDGATYFAERVWGLAVCHGPGGSHPLIGRSAPDFVLADGTRLGVLLRDGGGVLLNFAGDAALRVAGEHLRGHLKYVEADAQDRLGLGAVLVRPDGLVAWACDGMPRAGEMLDALSQWLRPGGPPH